MSTHLEKELRRLVPFPKVLREDNESVKKPIQRVRRKKLGPERRVPKPPPRAASTEFEYVLKDSAAQRIGFGSTSLRDTRGAARIALTVGRETDKYPNIGPTAYDTPTKSAIYPLLNKVTSIYGVGISARRAKRFTDPLESPGPADHLKEPPPTKSAAAPFNVGSKRKSPFADTVDSPGPGSYRLRPEPTRSFWNYHFGAAPREPLPLVVVRCSNGQSLGKCMNCEQELPSGKEYWHNPTENQWLCTRCMREQKRATAKNRFTSKFTFWQLESFHREHDCSDFHQHEGTTAKIHLTSEAVIARRVRKAVYLGRFFVDDGPPDDPDWDKRPAVLVEGTRRMPNEHIEACPSKCSTVTCLDQLSDETSRTPSLNTEECLKRIAAQINAGESSDTITEQTVEVFDTVIEKMASFKESLRQGSLKKPEVPPPFVDNVSEMSVSVKDRLTADGELGELTSNGSSAGERTSLDTTESIQDKKISIQKSLKSSSVMESHSLESMAEQKVRLEKEEAGEIESLLSGREHEILPSKEITELSGTEQRQATPSEGVREKMSLKQSLVEDNSQLSAAGTVRSSEEKPSGIEISPAQDDKDQPKE